MSVIEAPVKNWSLTVSPYRLYDLACLQYNEYSNNWRLQHCGLCDIFFIKLGFFYELVNLHDLNYGFPCVKPRSPTWGWDVPLRIPNLRTRCR
jgi:hypothetical protein